jgi:hypothetical protein
MAVRYLQHIFPADLSEFESIKWKDLIKRVSSLIFHTVSYRSTLPNLVILFVSVVGLVSSLVRYELIEILQPDNHTFILFYIIWFCVLSSSLNCCLIYLKIFYEFAISLEMYINAWRETIKKFNIFYPMMCLMACVMITIIAMWDLFTGMLSWRSKLVEYRLPGIKFYYILLVSRLVQRLLACKLITV